MNRPCPPPSRLAHLQGWAYTAFVAKDPAAGSATPPLEGWIQEGSGLSPAERVAIYAGNYRARLHESLGEQFPVLKKVLGPSLFDTFVEKFIEDSPPEGYSLQQLAGAFPAWLEATRPRDEAWAAFVAELASLERDFEATYHGPGHETQALWNAQPVLVDPVRLLPSPSLRLSQFHFTTDAYFEAVRAGRTPEAPLRQTVYLALYRRRWRVRMLRLDEATFGKLQRILDRGFLECPRPAVLPYLENWLELGILGRHPVP